ncbi:MAG: hypothetical protein V3R26_02820, partial [Hyphomicrobium sp.]
LGHVFECMEIAEGEISAAKRRTRIDDQREAIHGSFRYLLPTEPLRDKHLDLYRAHVRELIERVRLGEPVDPGTKAEVVAVLADLSLEHPLDPTAALLYARLFAELFPHRDDLHYAHPYSGERFYEDDASVLFARFRKKLTRQRDSAA